MKLGNASAYAPYVNYLLSQPHGQLPSHWSDAGKQLLYEVIGELGDQILPPVNPAGSIDNEWKLTVMAGTTTLKRTPLCWQCNVDGTTFSLPFMI
jgi:hypothetical protein